MQSVHGSSASILKAVRCPGGDPHSWLHLFHSHRNRGSCQSVSGYIASDETVKTDDVKTTTPRMAWTSDEALPEELEGTSRFVCRIFGLSLSTSPSRIRGRHLSPLDSNEHCAAFRMRQKVSSGGAPWPRAIHHCYNTRQSRASRLVG